jgi:beta-mannosidase
VTLPANAATVLAEFPRAEWEAEGLREAGAFAVLLEGERPVAQHRLFLERFKDLALAEPEIHVEPWHGATAFTSETFAWGVCLDVDGQTALPDNCFDLIPGVPYVVDLPWQGEAPQVVRVGNAEVG